MLDLLDRNTISWNILLLVAAEIVLVSWVYGVERFLGNIEEMGMKLSKFAKLYWKICWSFVTPILCIALAITSLNGQGSFTSKAYTKEGFTWNENIIEDMKENPNTTDGTYTTNGTTWGYKISGNETTISYVWPDGSQTGQVNTEALGWMIALAPLLLVPLVAIFQFCKRAYEGNPWQGRVMFQPSKHWKPNKGYDSTENMLQKNGMIKRQFSTER